MLTFVAAIGKLTCGAFQHLEQRIMKELRNYGRHVMRLFICFHYALSAT
jgi:hypothetical protein